MLLDDLADYMTSGGIGTQGTTLFKGYMPDAPDACTVIYETGGRSPVHTMNPNAGQSIVEMPRVQVVCRGPQNDYVTPRNKIKTAFALLDGLPQRTINGVEYKWGAAVQSPFPLGRDVNGRITVACNFDIVKAVTP